MKCLWYLALTLLVGVSYTTSANAQADWGSPSQIGSYQSILSSYAQQANGGSGAKQMPVQSGIQSAQPIQGAPFHSAPIQGAPFQGAPFQGAPFQGGPIQGGPIQGGPIQGAYHPPTYVQPSYVAPSSPVGPVQGGVVQGAPIAPPSPVGAYQSAGAYQPAVAFDTGIPCGTGGGPVSFGEPVYSAPAFESPAIAVASAGPQRNRVFGARGLFFSRTNENNRELSFNGASEKLNSNDASHGSFGGFETFLTSRGTNGTGWEARYLGLYPSQATTEIVAVPGIPPLNTTLRGLQDLNLGGGNVFNALNAADRHTLTRDTDIDSIDFNFLRNAGSTTGRHGSSQTHELLLGFRWFQFDEDLSYQAFAGPNQISYNLETQNTLLGLQLGSRSEAKISKRLGLVLGTKFGLFNNRTRTRQVIFDNAGGIANIGIGADAGTEFNFNEEDNSLAALGEFDLGLTYQISCRSRFNFGYRAIGVSGVALAGDQVPNNFASIPEIREIDNSGSLILQGGYAGLEMSY